MAEAKDWGKVIEEKNVEIFDEFLTILEEEIAKAQGRKTPLSLVFIASDSEEVVLPFEQAEKSKVDEIASVLRDAGLEGRFLNFGYERLAIIFSLNAEDSLALLETGLKAINENNQETVSVGFSTYPKNGFLAEELAGSCLDALSQAVKSGGNCLIQSNSFKI